ncbi:NAD(P)/FAD-dependent oxidoreductase [Rhodococcus opacus]|uniref:NAD(P)/FAD-dependent oxidoreductase n=1 Tax=Rhodococcus opacus TaxID=37919 RepID=UPI001C46BC85|nr:FAD-dependent oxidoreductase [Rhodococcus opacus]MBV6754854.1 FAD-binding oxidoreductase [Rhodococcus opacus]
METLQKTTDFANGDVSFWFREIGTPAKRPPLPGSIDVDVVIVGAGLTGLWTAYYLATAAPDLRIAVVEKEFAGYGASGRNGGWLSGEPAGQFRRYAKTHGVDSAKLLQRNMFTTIDEVLSVAQQEGIDADIEKDGLIHVATNEAQLHRLTHHVDQLRDEGWDADDLYFLTPSELNDRVRVAGARGAFWTPHCARIHPAKFIVGLAEAVERLGVTIYEDTPADRVSPGAVSTKRGTVTARYVVQALEGYTDSLSGQRRKLMPMNSSMIVTEPLPDSVWAEIGWDGAELVGDMGHSFAYSQRTADGRIALGGRGVPYNFASSFDPNGSTAHKAVGQLMDKLRSTYPAVAGSAVQHTWSGVLGVPRDWCAAVNFDRASGVAGAGGYVGHGLTGTNLAARTLRDLILERDSELTRLPWVGRQVRRWEVEPVRWIGASALYAAYRFADRHEAGSPRPQTALTAKVADKISGR